MNVSGHVLTKDVSPVSKRLAKRVLLGRKKGREGRDGEEVERKEKDFSCC